LKTLRHHSKATGIALFNKCKRANYQPANRLEKAAQFVAGLTNIFSLLVLIGVFASLFNIYGKYTGNLPFWPFVSALSLCVAFLMLTMIFFTILVWLRKSWRPAKRVHYTLMTLGAIGLVWFMFFWNILGKSF